MLLSIATHSASVDAMVATAVAAQQVFQHWSEDRVDALLGDIADRVAEHAERLAAETVRETGMGNVPDKVVKNRLIRQLIYPSIAGKPGTGLLRVDERQGIAEIASPMGVVFGLVPRTHPVATFAFKVLIALKSRNALILSCHRAALGVGNLTGELVNDVLERHGAPAGLVQWIKARGGRETTLEFMRHPDVAFILATGGASMVQAAYSSGTPAIGVGPGNAPTWVCADADLDAAARAVVDSKSFDNGVVCASEHNLVVERTVVTEFVAALERHGARVVTPPETDRVLEAVFDRTDNHVRGDLLGQSAERLAEVASLPAAEGCRVLVVPATLDQIGGPLGYEKLAPIMSLFVVDGDDQALDVSRRLLNNEGRGHTAIIHTRDQARIDRFSLEVPASRILVNVPGAQGTLGMCSGLVPSMTLGSGTFGRTSTTDSVTYTHLLNIKRVVYAAAA